MASVFAHLGMVGFSFWPPAILCWKIAEWVYSGVAFHASIKERI